MAFRSPRSWGRFRSSASNSMSTQPIQNNGAKGFIEKRVALPRMTGANATERHERKTAKRLPPTRVRSGRSGRLSGDAFVECPPCRYDASGSCLPLPARLGFCIGVLSMALKWREFHSWRCETCGTESLILERTDDLLGEASIFARACASCGTHAAGTTVRPAQTAYRVVARREWRPVRSLRHTT
jgi:hypothetical protein